MQWKMVDISYFMDLTGNALDRESSLFLFISRLNTFVRRSLSNTRCTECLPPTRTIAANTKQDYDVINS